MKYVTFTSLLRWEWKIIMQTIHQFFTKPLPVVISILLIGTYLTWAADLIDLLWLIPSLFVLPFLMELIAKEKETLTGKITSATVLIIFALDRVTTLNRVSGYGIDTDGDTLAVLVFLILLILLVHLLGLIIVSLVRKNFRCVLLCIGSFFIMPLPIFDVAPFISRQIIAKHLYGIDITKTVVTKLPYGEQPISFTYSKSPSSENPSVIVNGILLPNGSWTQNIVINPMLINIFYTSE